jgi:hypothetical protein
MKITIKWDNGDSGCRNIEESTDCDMNETFASGLSSCIDASSLPYTATEWKYDVFIEHLLCELCASSTSSSKRLRILKKISKTLNEFYLKSGLDDEEIDVGDYIKIAIEGMNIKDNYDKLKELFHETH